MKVFGNAVYKAVLNDTYVCQPFGLYLLLCNMPPLIKNENMSQIKYSGTWNREGMTNTQSQF